MRSIMNTPQTLKTDITGQHHIQSEIDTFDISDFFLCVEVEKKLLRMHSGVCSSATDSDYRLLT